MLRTSQRNSFCEFRGSPDQRLGIAQAASARAATRGRRATRSAARPRAKKISSGAARRRRPPRGRGAAARPRTTSRPRPKSRRACIGCGASRRRRSSSPRTARAWNGTSVPRAASKSRPQARGGRRPAGSRGDGRRASFYVGPNGTSSRLRLSRRHARPRVAARPVRGRVALPVAADDAPRPLFATEPVGQGRLLGGPRGPRGHGRLEYFADRSAAGFRLARVADISTVESPGTPARTHRRRLVPARRSGSRSTSTRRATSRSSSTRSTRAGPTRRSARTCATRRASIRSSGIWTTRAS